MNKYYRSSLQLIFIVTMTLILSTYWLDLEIGFGIILLIIAVGYTIYRNLRSRRNKGKNIENNIGINAYLALISTMKI